MPTSRPFAYNTGSTISGTEQVGNLAIGVPTSGFTSTGLQWWNGPDEDLGYVIAYPQSGGTQPTPTGGFAYVQFWRTKLFTDQDFINLCNSVIKTQTFTDVITAKNYLNTNGYWTSYVVISPTPSITPTITPSITPTITPSNTPTITPTPSSTPSAVGAVTFSQTFTGSTAPSASIETAWTTFRGQLTGTYTTMTISNNLGTSVTVTDAKVQDIANALRTGTTGTNFSVVIGARTWRVVHGCVAGTETANSIYLTSSGVCDCGGGTTYTVRPMIKNANWGGLNGSSCGQPTQTITVTFS